MRGTGDLGPKAISAVPSHGQRTVRSPLAPILAIKNQTNNFKNATCIVPIP
jgi:hypothetical protein